MKGGGQTELPWEINPYLTRSEAVPPPPMRLERPR